MGVGAVVSGLALCCLVVEVVVPGSLQLSKKEEFEENDLARSVIVVAAGSVLLGVIWAVISKVILASLTRTNCLVIQRDEDFRGVLADTPRKAAVGSNAVESGVTAGAGLDVSHHKAVARAAASKVKTGVVRWLGCHVFHDEALF